MKIKNQVFSLLCSPDQPDLLASLPSVIDTIYLRQDVEEMCKISGDSTAHYRAGEQSSLDIKNRTSIFQEDPPEGILNVFCPDTNDVAQKKKMQ